MSEKERTDFQIMELIRNNENKWVPMEQAIVKEINPWQLGFQLNFRAKIRESKYFYDKRKTELGGGRSGDQISGDQFWSPGDQFFGTTVPSSKSTPLMRAAV